MKIFAFIDWPGHALLPIRLSLSIADSLVFVHHYLSPFPQFPLLGGSIDESLMGLLIIDSDMVANKWSCRAHCRCSSHEEEMIGQKDRE